MKKLILTLLVILSFICIENVYAVECNSWQIESGNETLKNLTYDLEYDAQFTNINGYEIPGYFKIYFPNLPEGYYVKVNTIRGNYKVFNTSDYVYSPGGVVRISVYSNECDTVMKTFEARIPFYKQYCDDDVDCDQNLWFDGTYENTEIIPEEDDELKISTLLLIILIVLLVVVAIIVFLVIRKRRYNEQDF